MFENIFVQIELNATPGIDETNAKQFSPIPDVPISC